MVATSSSAFALTCGRAHLATCGLCGLWEVEGRAGAGSLGGDSQGRGVMYSENA